MFKVYSIVTIGKESSFDISKGQCYSNHTIEFNYNTVLWETITKNLLMNLSKNAFILDSGCGLGRWVHYFKKLGYNIIGLEYNKYVLSMAKQYDSSIRVVCGDFLNMPFKDEVFDTVISIGSYEHVEEGLMKPIQETYRILKDGGKFHLVVPVINLFRQVFGHWLYRYKFIRCDLEGFIRKLFKKKPLFKKVFAEYRYHKKEVLKILKQFNFKIVEINYEDFVYPHSLILLCDGGKYFAEVDRKTGRRTWELNKIGLRVLSFLQYLPKKYYYSNIHITCLKLASKSF